jgi:hypothetical protein
MIFNGAQVQILQSLLLNDAVSSKIVKYAAIMKLLRE